MIGSEHSAGSLMHGKPELIAKTVGKNGAVCTGLANKRVVCRNAAIIIQTQNLAINAVELL